MNKNKEEIKKSRHIPRKGATTKNIIRAILLSIDERTKLSYEMCNISKKMFLDIIKLLISQGVVVNIDENRQIEDTTGFLIYDYDKAYLYTKSSFKKCLEEIEKNLIPFLNIGAAAINCVS